MCATRCRAIGRAFTGLINVTGAGFQSANANTVGAVQADIDELRINNSFGYTNATIYLTKRLRTPTANLRRASW